MFEVEEFRADHKDVIHDCAYDFYGKRLATCSSDQYIKVWDQDDSGKWKESASWKAHSGSIWRISWAHPEFGQVLATCSFDRTAVVWEETTGEKTANSTFLPSKKWVRRTSLVDSRTSVTDVKFSPKLLGLLLATSSIDGIIRIYEAPDIMNLTQWSIQHEISCKVSLKCLSWNKSFFKAHLPLLATGSDEIGTPTGKLFLHEYCDSARKWLKIDTPMIVTDSINDVAFAPNVGRSYRILAVASQDLYILNINQAKEPTQNNRWDITLAAKFSDHNCPVWRVCWNVTGTMLASSGDDGCVRIWKMNYMKQWKCAGVVKANGIFTPNIENHPITTSPVSTPLNSIAKYYIKANNSLKNKV